MSYCFVGTSFPRLGCSPNQLKKGEEESLNSVILLLGKLQPNSLQKSRDVIRSPDIRTFKSRSEVRTQFQYPEVRIKY